MLTSAFRKIVKILKIKILIFIKYFLFFKYLNYWHKNTNWLTRILIKIKRLFNVPALPWLQISLPKLLARILILIIHIHMPFHFHVRCLWIQECLYLMLTMYYHLQQGILTYTWENNKELLISREHNMHAY